jgi:hypothetical protein
MLLACFAADVTLKRAGTAFPASVAVLVLLFLCLLLSERLLGTRKTAQAVAVINIPVRYLWGPPFSGGENCREQPPN